MHPDSRLSAACEAIRADAAEARTLGLTPCTVHPGLVRVLRMLADVTGANPPSDESLGLAIALSVHRAYRPLISSPDDVRAVFDALVAVSTARPARPTHP